MRVDLFDYELPLDRIAQHPVDPRDSSRLLVLNKTTAQFEHRIFRDLGDYLHPGDVLVLNDTRVLPARIYGHRAKTGGKWEGLFLHESRDGWVLMTRTRGTPHPGEQIQIDGADWSLELIQPLKDGQWIAKPTRSESPLELLANAGHVPIPPYIRSGHDEPLDHERYQTVYASQVGAVAAPTAGLHFTRELLTRLRDQGVGIESVTLHVGPGTFQPVSADDTQHHQMHSEWCEIEQQVASRLLDARRSSGRVVAVGTTVTRTLETAASRSGSIEPFRGPTDLFITPPYTFRAVDALLTNFHLPRSTLLMLVSAFAGIDTIRSAYQEAIAQQYRFYSYGDAMLIL